MRPSIPSSRLLLLALALELLLALMALVASQGTPGIASIASRSPVASPTELPTASPRASPAPDQDSPTARETEKNRPSPSPSPGRAEGLTLGELLALLPVAPEGRAGYKRDLFPLWVDADGDGCNTRKEVLLQEAIAAPTIMPPCALVGGLWLSLYDGLVLTDASQVQIDHVVALAEAWDSGASAWSTARRQLFANDLDVPWTLIAVSGASNESKADSDPADWLPSEPDAVCPFVSAWIAVKARWGLSVDEREKSALTGLILGCPDVRMPLAPAPTAEPTPVPAPSGACSPAYPTVCIPPPPPDLDCGDIPYRRFAVLAPDPHHFDGDHNGIGCESG